MPIKAVLFDLDGTLLPMDQNAFIKAYFGGLASRLGARGYDPADFYKAMQAGIVAMVKNTGDETNETVFWNSFKSILGDRILEEYGEFEAFYEEEFPSISSVCGHDARARAVVDAVHAKGLTAILATNPVFPRVATRERMRWAGVTPEDFAFFTTYENYCHCKPNPDYYRDVLRAAGLSPEECVMVGNDMDEDMVAAELGIRVFLLTDCLINRHGKDIEAYPHGGYDDLLAFLQAL